MAHVREEGKTLLGDSGFAPPLARAVGHGIAAVRRGLGSLRFEIQFSFTLPGCQNRPEDPKSQNDKEEPTQLHT